MTRKNKLLLFGATAIAATCLIVAAFGFVWSRGYSYVLKDAPYSEARKGFIVRIFIPPEARKITAWVQPYRMNVVAAFQLSEEDFVAWAKSQEWELEEVQEVSVHNISRLGDANDKVDIKSGLLYRWIYDADDPGSTYRVYAYDRADGTGYFTQLGD